MQAHALGLFFDEMINTFDPDALIVGGARSKRARIPAVVRRADPRRHAPQREEQAGIPIYIMPNGDTAGSRGAAIEAFDVARSAGLV